MQIISMLNAKGGVGKTTSTINVASILAEKGYKVLVVDMDPQANSTLIFESDESIHNSYCISDLISYKIKDCNEVIQKTNYENIDLLPCTPKLREVEREILLDVLHQPQTRLDKVLQSVSKQYDYCIIDCPPQLNLLAVNVLVASNRVLVPIKIDKFALDGLEELLNQIETVRQEMNPNLVFAGCFITMDSNTNVNKQIKQALKGLLGDLLFDVSIRQNIAVVESTFDRTPVTIYKKHSNASLDYQKLVEEVF